MGRTIRFTNRADNFVQGYGANNLELTLFLLDGNDHVELDRTDAQGGGNRVDMGRGNDYLLNFEGKNVIQMGEGNDTYYGLMTDYSADRPGDTVRGGAGNDFFATLTVKSHYFGGNGADAFVTFGIQNRFDGGSGRDLISYDTAAIDFDTPGSRPVTIDLTTGRATSMAGYHDTLVSIEDVIGTKDNDIIRGSAIGNSLVGGEGIDQLTGRGGSDTFIWRTADEAPIDSAGMDRITDFRRVQGDKIDLARIDAKEGAFAGNQAFTFIGNRAFSDKAGELSIFRQNADLILRGDTDGDGIADFRIRLIGVTSLAAGDLIL